MSQENVELLQRVLEVYNAHDVEGMIAFCDPKIEFESAFAAVGGALYHGHDGVRNWYRDVEELWGEDTRVEPEAFFDLGEHALVFHLYHGRGQQSGVEVEMPIALVTRWRDGLMVHLKGYAHREDAVSELGLSEDALERIEP
jgi:ketosteroid isomerase-like protein